MALLHPIYMIMIRYIVATVQSHKINAWLP